MITCLNCGRSFHGNFCPNCGQKATAKRLTAAGLLEDLFHFFTHLENGFFYTSWNFLARPGISSVNFISGKRKNFQKPVSFFLIWTGLYILLHNWIINYRHFQLADEIVTHFSVREQSNILFRNHFSLFIIPVIMLSAFIMYYVLARSLYNMIELLTLCLYGAGIYFMMCFLSDFVLGLLFKVNTLSTEVFIWQSVLSMIYNFWFCFDLFRRFHLRLFWLRLISVSILVAVGGLAIMFYLPMAWLYLTGYS